MDAIEARGVVNQWMQVPQRSLGRRRSSASCRRPEETAWV